LADTDSSQVQLRIMPFPKPHSPPVNLLQPSLTKSMAGDSTFANAAWSRNGSDFCRWQKERMTALNIAATRNHPGVISVLLGFRADVNTHDQVSPCLRMQTVAQMACRQIGVLLITVGHNLPLVFLWPHSPDVWVTVRVHCQLRSMSPTLTARQNAGWRYPTSQLCAKGQRGSNSAAPGRRVLC
jgi:hypothetical protein